jgi:hypothetical protein
MPIDVLNRCHEKIHFRKTKLAYFLKGYTNSSDCLPLTEVPFEQPLFIGTTLVIDCARQAGEGPTSRAKVLAPDSNAHRILYGTL